MSSEVYGSDPFAYDFAAALASASVARPRLDRVPRKPTAHERRIREALRLHQEHVSVREIAGRMGLSARTVRKYLSDPDGSHVTKPSEMQPTSFSAAPRVKIPSPRKTALRERVRALRDAGLVPSAIADRLGKTDRTIGRYLAELEEEEHTNRAAPASSAQANGDGLYVPDPEDQAL